MKRGLVILTAAVLAVCLMGATRGWRGAEYSGTGVDTLTLDFGGTAELVTMYAPDENYTVVFLEADGDTIMPAVTNEVAPGGSDIYLTYPAGVPVNEYAVRATHAFIDKSGTTELFIYWR